MTTTPAVNVAFGPVTKRNKIPLTTGKYDRLSRYETQAYHDPDTGCGVVIYRGTPIVSWTPDQIFLNTGGWQTVTTKRKMNQAANQFGLGFSVHQHKHQWYVTGPDGVETIYGGDSVINPDGIRVHVIRR